MQGTPNLEDVIPLAINAALATIDTAMVCKVVSYQVDDGTATLRPVTKRRVPNPEGGTLLESYPDIPAVRVLHAGGADWCVHVPLKADDTVVILCAKADFSEWLSTGEVSAPADVRLFRLAFAMAIPGIRRNGPQGATTNDITFTHSSGFKVSLRNNGTMEVGGASDSVALASKVSDLADFVYSHAHTFAGTGTVQAPIAGPVPAGPFPRATLTGIGSTKLKVGG